MDSRSRPQEEMTLREFEEEMQEEGVDWVQEAKAIQEEKIMKIMKSQTL